MPRTSLSGRLLAAIRQSASGISLGEAQQRFPQLSRRTLQRLLSGWHGTGLLRREGKGPATRYLAPLVAGTAADAAKAATFPDGIPISADSREVLAYVSQPMQARKPVGYDDAFLERYGPHTPYLSETLRRQLHRMGRPDSAEKPVGTYAREVLDRLLIDLSWASSQLEGNTYTRLDTLALIKHGEMAQGKSAAEAQMILNHKAAIELLVDSADEARVDTHTFLSLHGLLSENLLPNPADEGRLRRHAVLIGQSVFRPIDVPQQVEERFRLVMDKARAIDDPFEQAFFLMVHVPYLQPFADVNKRVSRVGANLPLIKANLCPLTFVGVPESAYTKATLGVYEMTRIELLRDVFVWAYERSTQEFLAIKRDLVQPDPARLKHRMAVKELVADVVRRPESDTFGLIRQLVEERVDELDRDIVQELVVDELRRLHEGVLARYGLRPSELQRWRDAQSV